MLPKHAIWAKLIKEHFIQNKNNEKCVDKIFERVYKQGSHNKTNAKYVTDCCLNGKIFDYSFIQVFTRPSGKWKESQSSLCSFFKGNPSLVCLPRNPVNTASSPVLPSVVVHSATTTTNQQAAATKSTQQATMTTINHQTTFDPTAFMKQFADQMMAVQQKSKTIVVESHEDKTLETEAKFYNNMLQFLLIGGTVDFLSQGSFVDPWVAMYTQAMKNILLQPASVRVISMVNILTTVFGKIPTNLAERLSPLTTGKSMHHISKNFASALLGANFLCNNLESLNYETTTKRSGESQCPSRCWASC